MTTDSDAVAGQGSAARGTTEAPASATPSTESVLGPPTAGVTAPASPSAGGGTAVDVLPASAAALGAPFLVAPARGRLTRARLVPGIVLAVIAALLIGVVSWALLRPTAEDDYLQALRAQGLGGQFASDAVAVAKGQAFCRGLRDGAEPQGMPADHVAVRTLCAEFAPGFHVLREAHVTGTFTLYDSSYYGSGIAAYGGTCTGDGGYSDIGPGTDVVVKDGSGALIATTRLGMGSGTSSRCEFSFSLDLMEGADDYVVSVSDRGEEHYAFTTLREDGIDLTLGD